MFITTAERTDLGHLGMGIWATERRNDLILPAKDGCVLVWLSEEQALMPDLIVVQNGELQNFLAWATTYIPQLCPLTALVRVVEHRVAVEDVRLAANKSRLTSDRSLRRLRGCLGIVNAEVVAACRGSFAPFNAGLTPHLSTFSWLALQVQYLKPELPLRGVHEAWNETRRLLGARPVDYSTYIEDIWSIIADNDAGIGSERRHQVEQIRKFLSSVEEGRTSESLLEATQEAVQAV